MLASLILNYICTIALIIEIFLRKYIIEKFFPCFKIPLKFNLSCKSNRLLSILFYILFFIASIPLVLTVLASIVTTIEIVISRL